MRNIVLIVVDTLRADHLGCYGYDRPTSPFLDSLADNSLVMDACYSASNYTAPAFTSLFTATYPSRHGVFDFTSQAKRSLIKCCLDANNARAEGVVSFRFFPTVLARIWGNVEVVTDTRSFDYSKDLPKAVSDGAIEWLESNGKDGAFCLFLHYDGPHIPYRLPDGYAEMFDSVDAGAVEPDIRDAFFPQHLKRLKGQAAQGEPIKNLSKIIKSINVRGRSIDEKTRNWLIDKYDASIRYTDDMIARVFEALQSLGLMEDTVFCVLSDHGEEFWDHGHFGHADVHMYDEIIRTAGIIHDPQQPEGWRTSHPVSHIQVIPTLLGLAGASHLPESLAALDIDASLERVESSGLPEPVFCIGNFKSAVRLDNLKLIRSLPNRRDSLPKRARRALRLFLTGEWRDELYDVAADPGEKVNLSRERGRSRPLAELLEQHFASEMETAPARETTPDLDEAEREKIEKELRDLGYM